MNFKGLFVGNPYTDPVENAKGQYDTWYGHQLTSLPTYLDYLAACDDGEKYYSDECEAAELLLTKEVGDIDPYALDFPVCNRNLSMLHSDYFDFISYSEKLSHHLFVLFLLCFCFNFKFHSRVNLCNYPCASDKKQKKKKTFLHGNAFLFACMIIVRREIKWSCSGTFSIF